MKTADAARGKWRGILLALGVDQKFLGGKHGPCPLCEGKDRFRWDNRDGSGGFICNQCGAGNGFDLLMRLKGWDFKTTAAEVDKVVGNASAEPVKPPLDPQSRADMLNALWKGSKPVERGDPAFAYLSGRVTLPASLPSCLRFHPSAPVPYGGGRCPAMLAMVMDAEGNPASIHRTFLGPNGKADMENPRAMMPGDLPDGSAVRLFPVHGARLGIAEGIETAFAAAAKFGLPVWSAINSTMLAKWQPPQAVEEVVVFGDADAKFGGQAAAFALAHRLSRKLAVSVRIPGKIGRDWADSDVA